VETAQPEPFPYTRTLRLGGTLEPAETVQVAARVDGAVTKVAVDLGDRVARGAVLARITPEDFRARVAQLDAELTQARAEQERVEQLGTQQLATAQQLEQARTKVSVLRAQRVLAARQLRDTAVTAPFGGAIAARHIAPGAYVRIGTPLFDLVAVDELQVALQIPERHASTVQEGNAIELSHESAATRVPGTVVRVAPTIDPATRTFRIEARVDPAGAGLLRPGMFVEAAVPLGRVEDSVRLPRSAVYETLGRSRVTLVRAGRAETRDVELLGEEEGWAIVRGLVSSDVVVSRNPASIAPGTPVRAGNAPPTPPPTAQEHPPGRAG
jgi:RND family efflux transporter MFP subunit